MAKKKEPARVERAVEHRTLHHFLSWCMVTEILFAAIKIAAKAPVPWWGVFIPAYPVAIYCTAEILGFFFMTDKPRKKEHWDDDWRNE